jgi:8-amino-7-oxononanoate synthase
MTALERRVRKRLADLQALGLWRTLRAPSGIDLSSNDYLGLSTHPQLMHQMMEAVRREGCGSTGSRLLRGERESFSAIERRFADFKRTERAIYLSSGYLANLATLTTLPESGDVVYSDALNHASLIDGIRLSRGRSVIFPHNDVDALARLLKEDVSEGQKFVVVESLFSMDGDLAPLPAYADLCRTTGAALMVDEAHAVGIYGARGSGLIEAAGVGEHVLVSMNPAGKALGVSGGFVAGPAWAIEHLTQHARPFIFSTAAPPAIAAALDASLTVIDNEPARRHLLQARARHLRAQLGHAEIPVIQEIDYRGASQIVSIVLGGNARATAAAQALQREGFDVRAIRPPTVPAGTARLRITVNINLSEATLDRFVSVLAGIVREQLPCTVAYS